MQGRPASAAAGGIGNVVLACALGGVTLLELVARASGVDLVQWLAWGVMIVALVLSWPRLGKREWYLLTLSVAFTVADVCLHPDPMGTIASALNQATFLLSFMLLLGMLHDVASTSSAIRKCGEYLTQQPSGRRYYALNIGTAVLSVLFNMGVVSFLIPLIQGGIKASGPDDPMNEIRERRQVSAVLRGFAWCVIWSPTAIAPMALLQLIPGVDRGLWFQYGLGVFALVLILGALEDRWRYRGLKPAQARRAVAFPVWPVLRFIATCLWLFGLAELVVWVFGGNIVFGILLACPFVAVGWLMAQQGMPTPVAMRSVGRRLEGIFLEGLPKSASVAITLACSGYLGRVGGVLVPAQALAQFLNLDSLPDFLILSALPPLLVLISLLALSPIMLAVFFGSLFAALPHLPVDPTLLALSISCGWALSMTVSPFATVVLLIDRVSGIPARRLTWGWNPGFSLIGFVVLIPVFFVLTGGH